MMIRRRNHQRLRGGARSARLLLPACVALLLAVVSRLDATNQQVLDEIISVMSFNLRYGTADDGENSWPNRRELAFQVIREQAPDVIGTQEALRFQLDELREALPEYGEVGVGRDDGESTGEYAALLYSRSRFEVREHGTFWFSETPEAPGSIAWGARLPRICTWARLADRMTDRAFYLYNVHLDHESQESRERSVELLIAHISGREFEDPVVVTGDFNAGEDNPAMLRLLGATGGRGLPLRDSFRELHPQATDVGTFNGFRGTTSGPKIDGVVLSDGWSVVSASIVRTARAGRYPSDHFPVTARLRLTSTARSKGVDGRAAGQGLDSK
ncbi:MAG: endonuclease/exonuclease/phosphatase family protein [Gemmatimonadota bacterium]|nr:MAG: endonuclease/exonuclease/phosphatase family protein [Gemmatimonadota bacterium]